MVHTMGPHIQHWTQSGSLITMEIREGGLAVDTQYMAKITVSTLVGMESITVPFSEYLSSYYKIVQYIVHFHYKNFPAFRS